MWVPGDPFHAVKLFYGLIFNWIHGRRENMLRVSRKFVMKKVKHLYDENARDNLCAKLAFVASQSWFKNFMKRNCLSLRRRTTTTQKDSSYVIKKIVSYSLLIIHSS